MRFVRTFRAPHLGYFGAPVNYKGLASQGASIGAGAAATSAGLAAGPLTAGISAAAGLAVGLLLNANHPHGTCAPNAKTMADFLKCWSHAIPNDLMPIWTDMWGGSDGKGWVTCVGAVKGQPPASGCLARGPNGYGCVNGFLVGPDGQPSLVKGAPVNCAPTGTIAFDKAQGYISSGQAVVANTPVAQAAAGMSAGADPLSSTAAGIPLWLYLVGGGALLWVAMKK